MFFKLFLLFTVIPVVELALLIKIGSFIGIANTIVIVIITAIAGAYMVRSEGIGVMYRIQNSMQEGRFPGDELINGLLILIAGALLLTPGFFTDLLGFCMVIPITRKFIGRFVKKYIEQKISSGELHIKKY